MGERTLIVMRGVPGSGKDFYIKEYLSRFLPITEDSVCSSPCSADTKARNLCNVVIVNNTHIKRVDVQPYIQIASELGYQLRIIRLTCTPQLAASRNLHNIPQEKIQLMSNQMDDIEGEEVVESLKYGWRKIR